MRKFEVWVHNNFGNQEKESVILEFPDDASEEDIKQQCDDARHELISDQLDSGHQELLSEPSLSAEDAFYHLAIKEMKSALKQFGEYEFQDKGPEEVMDVETLSVKMIRLSPKSVENVLVKLSKYSVHGEQLVMSLLGYIDGDSHFEDVFDNEILHNIY